MKTPGAKRFCRRTLRNAGQVGFTKMDSGEIPRIKKVAFAVNREF